MFVTSVSMGAQTPLNIYAAMSIGESPAIERVAVDGLEAATLMIAGLAQLDETLFAIVYLFESAAEHPSATNEVPGRSRDSLMDDAHQAVRDHALLQSCSTMA
jgi:hypothetical protein